MKELICDRKIWVWLVGALLLVGPLPAPQAATLTVNSLDDVDDGVCNAAHCSLREAINAANASPGDDTITFSVSGTIDLDNGTLPDIMAGGTLTINGANQVTISGLDLYRVFFVSAATFNLQDLTVTGGNEEFGGGGGLFNDSGTVTITGCTFSGNNAYNGGGLINGGTGMMTIINSTVSNNSAVFGGGLENYSVVAISSSTFADNSASFGGGLENYGTVDSKNSIMANSSGGNCDDFGFINGFGVNLATDATCSNFTSVTPAELNLGPLADNGGPTETHALLTGSVAIDAVTDCTDLLSNAVNEDQRGVLRPIDGDGDSMARCDVGAFEAPAPPCGPPARRLRDDRSGDCLQLFTCDNTYLYYNATTATIYTGPVTITTSASRVTFQSTAADPNYLTGTIDLVTGRAAARFVVPRGGTNVRSILDLNINNNPATCPAGGR